MVDARRVSSRVKQPIKIFVPNPKGEIALYETAGDQLERMKSLDSELTKKGIWKQAIRNKKVRYYRVVYNDLGNLTENTFKLCTDTDCSN